MTAAEYIDEIELRLLRLGVVLDISEPMVLTYVNRARRLVQNISSQYLPERYAEIVGINVSAAQYARDFVSGVWHLGTQEVYDIALPDNIIDVWVVIVEYLSEGITYRNEARNLSKYEMQNVLRNAWRAPALYSPIYCIERHNDVGTYAWHLYLSGLRLDTTTTLFDVSTSINAELWLTETLPEIEDYNLTGGDDPEGVIPASLEELVIYYALLYCLQNMNMTMAYNTVLAETRFFEDALKEQYDILFAKQETLLPSKEEGP